MKIEEFLRAYENHPVLFVGTGISLRYLRNSYTWDGLLKKISADLYSNNEKYLDIKYSCRLSTGYDYAKVAEIIENDFNNVVSQPENREGKFKSVNDMFYESMAKGIPINRFKYYLTTLLKDDKFDDNKQNEIDEFKKVRKNIACVITTNYDELIENVFEFTPLIGNDILLSNPYGSVYKIHGSISDSDNIIISSKDYEHFSRKYELIRAQLLSLFIHNPIIFLGYNVGDDNIKDLLSTIFSYVEPNSPEAEKIRSNFLLVEYEKDSDNDEITEHDIQIDSQRQIRINKLKTDNYTRMYTALSNLTLPISAMDIRKVESIVKELKTGGSIRVQITESLDDLKNSDKVIAIGSTNTIKVEFKTLNELLESYFKIMDESNFQITDSISKISIRNNQWFAICGFKSINPNLDTDSVLEKQQIGKVKNYEQEIKRDGISYPIHNNIQNIFDDETIINSNKIKAIAWNVFERNITLEELKNFLLNFSEKSQTDYRKLLCLYDYLKFNQGWI